MFGAYPFFGERRVIDLNGSWDFYFLGESVNLEEINLENLAFCERAAVPGVFDAMPKYAGKRGTAVYHKKVKVSVGTPGKICFGGGGMWFSVYVDGSQ